MAINIMQAIYVAAILGIADLLKDGAREVDALAAATGTHSDLLYRVLRALAAIGVFHEDAERGFSLMPMGSCLRSDAPKPVGPWAKFIGRPYVWQAWGRFDLQRADRGATPFSMRMAPMSGPIVRRIPRKGWSSIAP